MAFSDLTTPAEIREYLLHVLSRPGNRKKEVAQLFHYTSIEALAAILDGGYIYLGSTDNMNDYFEGDIIRDVQGENTQFFTCFSRAEENLAMYKMYAPSPNGAMMKISFADALKIVEELPRQPDGKFEIPIVRDNRVTKDTVLCDVYWSAVAYKDLHTDLIRAGDVVNVLIERPFDAAELAGYIKLYGWEYEKEVRLCAKLYSPLNPGEKVAIKIPRTIQIQIVTGPGFDRNQNRRNLTSIRRKSIEVHASEYDAFVDLGYTELEAIRKLRLGINEKDKQIDRQREEIERLREELSERLNDDEVAELFLMNDTTIETLNHRLDILAAFSHSVSDQVKKLIAELKVSFDQRIAKRITDFLKESINSLEDILTEHYGTDIRSSIKLNIDSTSVRTFTRGARNINSRGGEYRCQELDLNTIGIDENYAYIAIVSREEKFFVSGNLLDMKNKFESDDVFFCEYGDDYLDIFTATIIMPIRVPQFNCEIDQEILGLLCIDAHTEIPEWQDSVKAIETTRGYHIIADYADSIAMLIKEYSDAAKDQED